MKKLICVILCLVVLLALAVPAMAADMEVIFTDDSSVAVGGTVTVDVYKTKISVLDSPNCTSEAYNAALEGNMQFFWYRNDIYWADGESITLQESDKGCTFRCQAVLYNDSDRIQDCGSFFSAAFTLPAGQIPQITTKSLPNGTVGENYYQKLECTNPDVVFGLLQSSLPDGLMLTQHGEIEGTPSKAGFWYVVVLVTDEYGQENTAEFEMYIDEKQANHTPSDWRTTQVYHYKVCTSCGDMLEQEDHTGGTASCMTKGTCQVCGYAYLPENEEHVPEDQWTACAGLYHAHLCKLCGAHCDPEEHIPGPEATETKPQTCKTCGYIITPAKNHVHKLTQVQAVDPTCTKEGVKAHYTCDGCSDLFADKDGKNKLEDTSLPALGHDMKDGKCTRCDYTAQEPTAPEGTQDVTQETKEPATEPTTEPEQEENSLTDSWFLWVILVALLAVMAVMIVLIILIITTRKKRA